MFEQIWQTNNTNNKFLMLDADNTTDNKNRSLIPTILSDTSIQANILADSEEGLCIFDFNILVK